MSLTYRSLLHAVASLRGPLDAIEPTAPAVRYRAVTGRGRPQLADCYVPREPTGASVVLVHGGAFVFGSRRMKPVRFVASQLCGAGIAVCAIDYRLIFRGGRLVEALDDVSAAVAFWQERSVWLGLDPARISIAGFSAGATLAMLAASREPGISRVVGCFGLYDVDHLRGRVAELLPRLLLRSPHRPHWEERLPARASHSPAPTLLLHGTGDGVVPVEQSQRLASAREARGFPTKLVIYPDAPHGFFNVPSAARDEGVREIIEFVR